MENMQFKYKGYFDHPSECEITIRNLEDGRTVIVMKDLGIGTSVTNRSEHIATEIYKAFLHGKDPRDLVWYELYEYPYRRDEDRYSVSEVNYLVDGAVFSKPRWIHRQLTEMNLLLGSPEKEADHG